MKMLILLSLLTGMVCAQDTLPDSIRVNDLFSIRPKYLLPEDWKKLPPPKFDLNYGEHNLKSLHFYNPPVIPENPFEIDMRGHPMYTPRMVRDELNLIMNRPREQAFVPILGVAYIAYQMAVKYLSFKSKLELEIDDIFACSKHIYLLEELWESSPQTCTELYLAVKQSSALTYTKMEQNLEDMADNNLVKTKNLEDDTVQFFPAYQREQVIYVLETARNDTMYSSAQKSVMDSLLTVLKPGHIR